jgi:hypothetical protein
MSAPPDARPGDRRQLWAERLEQQAKACAELGSDLYGRLLVLVAQDVAAGASTWDVLRAGSERVGGELRFGQAGPLRLLGAAHRLAITGAAPQWAALLPSCGGAVPRSDEALLVSWRALVDQHSQDLVEGLAREVQTNEVGRSAGLALAVAETRMREARIIELGCSAGLNLRFDRFEVDIGGMVLGHPGSPVQIRPEMRGSLGALRHDGLGLPVVAERVGIDPHPIDASNADGAATVRSFVWPDQLDRLARMDAAISVACQYPAELIVAVPGAQDDPTRDTAAVLDAVLQREGPAVVMHSIVWQYIPTAVRWRITEAIEAAGALATGAEPLAWVRYEPDEWDRRRAAVWLRSFPGGADQLVAHVDYHGRWLAPA